MTLKVVHGLVRDSSLMSGVQNPITQALQSRNASNVGGVPASGGAAVTDAVVTSIRASRPSGSAEKLNEQSADRVAKDVADGIRNDDRTAFASHSVTSASAEKHLP